MFFFLRMGCADVQYFDAEDRWRFTKREEGFGAGLGEV